MPFPDLTGYAPDQLLNGSFSGGSLDELAARYGLPPGTPQSVILERLNQDPTFTYGDTTTPPTSDAEALARLQGYTLNGQPLTNMISNGQAFITPQGSDASYYYIPDSGSVMTGYNPEQRAAIDDAQRDARISGIGTVAALVGGGAALGGLTAGAGAGGATTYPLAGAGGPITATPIATGVGTGTVAGSTAAAGVGAGGTAAAGAGSRFGNFLQNWGPEIAGGVNALLGYRAADQATDAETAAYQAAIEEQRRQYDTSRADLQPWMTAGQGALNNLQNPAASFAASPGYEWARNEGQRDIGNSFAARGGAASGNALRALTEFNTGLAQQDFGNWWNQQSSLAGLGQTATSNVASIGQNTSANVGNYLAGQGASRASGVLGKYGSIAGGLNDSLTNYLYRRRA